MRKLLLMLIFSFGVVAQPAHAAIDVYVFDDPVKDERFKAMSEELRCLVCQNQNIADSNAELAQDLKREIYEMITTGLTDKEIVDFMVKRYGDFVLYRPPVKSTTAFLWAGPFIIGLLGLAFLIYFIRARGVTKEEGGLSADENTRLSSLVDTDGKEENK